MLPLPLVPPLCVCERGERERRERGEREEVRGGKEREREREREVTGNDLGVSSCQEDWVFGTSCGG